MVMTTWEFTQNIFLALGGLGLFLMGLKTMSDGLKSVAGSRMRALITRATSNRFLGFLFGMLVTAVTQSSTATSIMAIGFVDAGLMKLKQFASIIIGAGVGTTFTAFLFNFSIDPIAPLFIFSGIILNMFFSKKKIKDIGFVTLGIGVLFFGLTTMSIPLREFSQLEGFQNILLAFRNPLLALLAGLLFTAIIQSSTATVGIIMTMYATGINIPFETSAFLILGANIGTCSTALLSSLAGSRDSKRAALIHAFYKLIAGGTFAIIIFLFPPIIAWFESTWYDGGMQIAMFHTIYNLIASGIMIFFTTQLVSLVLFIIPKRSKDDDSRGVMYIEESEESTPEMILAQAHNEMFRMGKMALQNLKRALEAFFNKDIEKAHEVIKVEETLNYLKNEITTYIMSVKDVKLSGENVEKFGTMLHIINDMERLGNYAENIAEYILHEKNYINYLSEESLAELYEVSKVMMQVFVMALEVFELSNAELLPQIEELEEQVDDLCELYLSNHIRRLRDKTCDPRCSVIFTSMINHIERCSDHALNIAERTIGDISQLDI